MPACRIAGDYGKLAGQAWTLARLTRSAHAKRRHVLVHGQHLRPAPKRVIGTRVGSGSCSPGIGHYRCGLMGQGADCATMTSV